MYRFRKKSAFVEAFQMTEKRRWDNSEWPEWLHAAWQLGKDFTSSDDNALWCDEEPPHTNIYLSSSEGVEYIIWNDWIIKDENNDLYVIDVEDFSNTYEVCDV